MFYEQQQFNKREGKSSYKKNNKHSDTFMELQHDYNGLKAESCIHFSSSFLKSEASLIEKYIVCKEQ